MSGVRSVRIEKVRATVTCGCDDWRLSAHQIFELQMMASLTGRGEYTGKRFEYCPWCGEWLGEEEIIEDDNQIEEESNE